MGNSKETEARERSLARLTLATKLGLPVESYALM